MFLAQIASTGLRPTVSPMTIPDHWGDALVRAVVRGRLTGHLCSALRRGEVAAPPIVAAAAETAHTDATMRGLRLEQTLLRVADVLKHQGISVRVLKGPALARTVYAERDLRTFVDVDLLVHTEDFDRAVAALIRAGYRRRLPELRPGFDRRFGKSVVFEDDQHCHVDLHRTLVVGPHGLLIALDDLFSAHRTMKVAGSRLSTLGADEQFLHACYHAALGDVPPRLATLRDVVQTVMHAPVDGERVIEIAARWAGLAVVARALTLAWSVLDIEDAHWLVGWAREYRPQPRERRLLACYTSPRRSNSRKYVATARVIPGVSAKATYLRALLAPERPFLDRRAAGWRAWWIHGATALLRGTPTSYDHGIGQPSLLTPDKTSAEGAAHDAKSTHR